MNGNRSDERRQALSRARPSKLVYPGQQRLSDRFYGKSNIDDCPLSLRAAETIKMELGG
jgi:hypothetical protein